MDQGFRTAAQISTYPMDFPHAGHLLAHQLRVWAPMVERIVLTIDVHRSRSGRYRGTDFDRNLAGLRDLARGFRETVAGFEAIEVDNDPAARREVAQWFFGRDDMPLKAWDGGPFYAYFYGLFHARARYVVHFDGDMLFGGGSRSWMEDAIRALEADPQALLANPYPGPPRADGVAYGQDAGTVLSFRLDGNPALAVDHASTRIFLADMQRLRALGPLPMTAPDFGQRQKARLLGNPPDVIEAEELLSRVMRDRGLHRIDMLGAAPGLWSLHPPYRGPNFYAGLPGLVAAVESGQVPDDQRGHYDVRDSMIDWSAERARTRRHRRLWRMLAERLGAR
ncbi:hypothetical protein [Roseococcus sp. YIM B11640]|uniref:hypothetical protein n=1 Tax=Roseococcus sp. YIM B11640 TaxID=3133973 RepID=UPI003C7BA766